MHYKTGSLIVYHGSDVTMSECGVNFLLEEDCTKCVSMRWGMDYNNIGVRFQESVSVGRSFRSSNGEGLRYG